MIPIPWEDIKMVVVIAATKGMIAVAVDCSSVMAYPLMAWFRITRAQWHQGSQRGLGSEWQFNPSVAVCVEMQ